MEYSTFTKMPMIPTIMKKANTQLLRLTGMIKTKYWKSQREKVPSPECFKKNIQHCCSKRK